MKSIYQLKKLYQRAARRSAGSLKALIKPKRKNPDAKPWKNNLGVNVKFHRARLNVCNLAKMAVLQDLNGRRVSMPGVRDARPLKIQHREAQENLVITTSGL